jgi:hypothetical protein
MWNCMEVTKMCMEDNIKIDMKIGHRIVGCKVVNWLSVWYHDDELTGFVAV